MHIGRSKYVPIVLILGFAIITLSRSSLKTSFRAQLSPEEAGTISWQDFQYEGAFLVSSANAGSSRFSYSWGNMAVDPAGDNGNGSLFLSGHLYDDKVAEVNIPAPQILEAGTSRAQLPRTSILQQFADVTSGYFAQFQQTNGNSELSGLAILQPPGFFEKQLFWTTRIYYNVWNGNPPSHGVASANLAAPDAKGPWLAQGGHNMVAGFLAPVPQDFADAHLNGSSLLTGQSGVAGNVGSSFGPVAFAIKPWMENGAYQEANASVSSTPLVYYPIDKPYPGFDNASRIEGMAWVSFEGKNALAFIGTIGTGHYWYGEGSDAGYTDPCSQSKGQHNSAFETRLYLYDEAELLKVTSGQINAWDARPSEVVNLTPYLNGQCSGPHSIAYDPVKQRLFIFESKGYIAPNAYEYDPAVHSFVLGNAPTSVNQPPSITSFTHTAVDRDAAKTGTQVYPGDQVTYRGVASDPDTAELAWKWYYSVNDQTEILHSEGTGAVQDASYTYSPDAAGKMYLWKLEVTDGEKTTSNTVAIEVTPQPAPIVDAATGALIRIGGAGGSRGGYFHRKDDIRNGRVMIYGPSAPGDLHIAECAPSSPMTAAEIFQGLGAGSGNAWGYQYKDKDAAYETNCVKNALNALPPRSIDECFLGPNAGKFIGRADGFPFVDPEGTLEVLAGEPYALFVSSMNVVSPATSRFARCTKPATPVCGDGFRDAAEPCDDGNTSNRDTCLATCTPNIPGDGFPVRSLPAAEPGEPCDDGDTLSSDGCSGTGVTETLYVCAWNETLQKDTCTIPLGGAPGL